MNISYMPFTYVPHSTARTLYALFGSISVIQPLRSAVPETLQDLSGQGVVDLRTPIEVDDERLRAAIFEFSEWAKKNPGASLAGAEYVGSRQGEIPFFDETSVNRIRSEIKRHGSMDTEKEKSDLVFCARLFLAIAQENDRATESMDRDLEKFNAMEHDFLASMRDADDARFNRKPRGEALWQEDQGAKGTLQRLRAWATLALAGTTPELYVTTSRAVMDFLQENFSEKPTVEKFAAFTVKKPGSDDAGLLKPWVEKLARQEGLSTFDSKSMPLPRFDSSFEEEIDIRLYRVANMSPAAFLHVLAPKGVVDEEKEKGATSSHTMIVFVENA